MRKSLKILPFLFFPRNLKEIKHPFSAKEIYTLFSNVRIDHVDDAGTNLAKISNERPSRSLLKLCAKEEL